ncbi:MAG: glutamyl-tRNA reductase [Deltaproteobacteria bacterium]|jgi:glutamyl-tRNA reductase|nr:glutamyl-tRNA reductase [Deltaproteobacteria bacterium]
MEIFIFGADHWRTPVALRELLARLNLAGPWVYDFLAKDPYNEALILSTCNRLEIVGVADDANLARAYFRTEIAKLIAVPATDLDEFFHYYKDLEAVRYLFRVTSGLESQVLGEPQILGQVKASFREALNKRAIGPVVSKLFHKSFRAAKRARAETDLAIGPVSVASAAVESAARLLGGLAGQRVVVLGAGEMAALTMAHLKERALRSLVVVNRTFARAQDLAAKWEAMARPWAELDEALADSDLVFTALGGSSPFLTTDYLTPLATGRPWWFFDLGLPRNVEEKAGDLPGLGLKNLDEIAKLVAANRESRQKEVARVEAIIEEELVKYSHWLLELGARPTIKALSVLAEEARELELSKTLNRTDFNSEQSQAVAAMSRALVRRILHNPLTFAKTCHRHGRADHNLNMVRRIFGLDPR